MNIAKLLLPGRRDEVKLAKLHQERINAILGGKLRLGGGAESYLTYPAVATALTTAQVAFMGPLLSSPDAPLVLALAYIPSITTVTAASTITLNINRTDTPAVIGGSSFLAATAGTANQAPITMMAIVPFGIPAANGVSVSGAASTGSPVPTGSATQPMILALVGLA